jgi:hypothetical protein
MRRARRRSRETAHAVEGYSPGARCRFAGAPFVAWMTGRTRRPAAPEALDMRYALLIYTPESSEPSPPDVLKAVMDGYNAFTTHVRDRGAYEGGEALDSTSTATTVRVRDGKTLTTDGPYAETKEALGGFYIVEAADLDEAITYAAMIPGAVRGAIEVRPIFDWAAAAADAAATGSAGAG